MPRENKMLRTLKSLRGEILTVTLQDKVTDAKEFWPSYLEEVCKNIRGYDGGKLRDALFLFGGQDNLEIVNKSGRLLKRFSKFWQVQLRAGPLNVQYMGVLGDRLQYFISSQESEKFYVDFTDDIDWKDGQFGHNWSCWWGCYSNSVPTFTHAGGWAIRFYSPDVKDMEEDDEPYDYGIGRTWILPHDGLFLCFNSYGVERPKVSKVIKQVFLSRGITLHYRTTNILNRYSDTVPYINGDSGFILYPDDYKQDDLLDKYMLALPVIKDVRRFCAYCGEMLTESQIIEADGSTYCPSCAEITTTVCPICEVRHANWMVHNIRNEDGSISSRCANCVADTHKHFCRECACLITESQSNYVFDGNCYVCNWCKDDFKYCSDCNQFYVDICACEVENAGWYTRINHHLSDSLDRTFYRRPTQTLIIRNSGRVLSVIHKVLGSHETTLGYFDSLRSALSRVEVLELNFPEVKGRMTMELFRRIRRY